MFYIEDDSGALRLEVGYNGCHHVFKYGAFDFGEIAILPENEPIFVAIAERLGLDIPVAMTRIRQGLQAKIEVDAFFEELKAAGSQLYYDLYRPVLSLEDMREEMVIYRNTVATRLAKKTFTARRRSSFNAQRDILVLRLLEAGIPYVCRWPGCVANTDLTVDHKLALSRGGSDELSNLQFLCVPHNSAKGDRDGPPELSGDL